MTHTRTLLLAALVFCFLGLAMSWRVVVCVAVAIAADPRWRCQKLANGDYIAGFARVTIGAAITTRLTFWAESATISAANHEVA